MRQAGPLRRNRRAAYRQRRDGRAFSIVWAVPGGLRRAFAVFLDVARGAASRLQQSHSTSDAGGFAAGSHSGRPFLNRVGPVVRLAASPDGAHRVGASIMQPASPAFDSLDAVTAALPAPGVQVVSSMLREFPLDLFEIGDCLATLSVEWVGWFRQRLPQVRRFAVHRVRLAVLKEVFEAARPHAARRECFAVYIGDTDGNEQPFLDFGTASSATYAALRLAQTYRLAVEFGNFNEPKIRWSANGPLGG